MTRPLTVGVMRTDFHPFAILLDELIPSVFSGIAAVWQCCPKRPKRAHFVR